MHTMKNENGEKKEVRSSRVLYGQLGDLVGASFTVEGFFRSAEFVKVAPVGVDENDFMFDPDDQRSYWKLKVTVFRRSYTLLVFSDVIPPLATGKRYIFEGFLNSTGYSVFLVVRRILTIELEKSLNTDVSIAKETLILQ